MSRTLTVHRVLVPAELEAEYLGALRELAALGAPHGRRLWVFRSAEEAGVFLECCESESPGAHRLTADLSVEEQRIERRLRQLVEYESTRHFWHEVPLGRPHVGAPPLPASA